MNMTKQHTQIPQNFDWKQLEWCDQLVFAQIKRFMNKDTRNCYPSMTKIKDLTQLSERFINDSVKRLESAGLVKITKRKGTSNLYYFPPETDNFEMFTNDFLDMKLPPKVKEYYMKIQNSLYDKDQEIAVTHYSDVELAQLTGLSIPTVKKYNKILQDGGYMTSAITNYKDEAGLAIRQMAFDMQKLGQFGLWVKAVTEQVSKNTDDIENIKRELRELRAFKEAVEKQSGVKVTSYSFDK